MFLKLDLFLCYYNHVCKIPYLVLNVSMIGHPTWIEYSSDVLYLKQLVVWVQATENLVKYYRLNLLILQT